MKKLLSLSVNSIAIKCATAFTLFINYCSGKIKNAGKSLPVNLSSGKLKLFIVAMVMVNSFSGNNAFANLLHKTDKTKTVTLPAMPGPICGPTNPCAWIGVSGVTYSIKKVAGATSYTWSVPETGASIIFHPGEPGVNDTIIVVNYTSAFTTGAIKVSANSNSGNSAIRSLTLTRLLPAMPGVITGPTNACQWIGTTGATYSIKKVTNATGYNWTVPLGANIISHPGGTGVNDTTIVVSYTNAFVNGNISVSAMNNCASSVVKNIAITRLTPALPGAITATAMSADCPRRSYKYAIAAMPANATTLLWTVPVGAVITSGQGTLSITVDYPQIKINDTVKVAGVNSCTNGAENKLKVCLAACASSQRTAADKVVKPVDTTYAVKHYECNDQGIISQADAIKQLLINDGFIVIKEAGISMENDVELPVAITLSSNAMYQFVFVGDISSGSQTLSIFDSNEKQKLYEKKISKNPDGNVISYSYRSQFSGYHIIKPSQVNTAKKNYCGYIIVLKKIE